MNIIRKYELNEKEMQLLSLILDSVKIRKKIELKGNIIIRKLHNGIIDFSVYPLQKKCKECDKKQRKRKKLAREE
jgi:hypothetical protein